MSAPYQMSVEELNDNYQFKVIKKALMREYPWIKNVFVTEDDLNKYSLIFYNIDIDPIELGEEMGWEVTPWVKIAADRDKEYHGMYFSLFFNAINYDQTKDLQAELNDLANSVGQSPAFPKDLLLKGNRQFSLGNIYMNHGKEHWF